MGDWSQSVISTCFTNCALSLTILCLAPLAVYKNAEKLGQPGLPWMLTILACPGAGGYLRKFAAKKDGADENWCIGWLCWCVIPCVPLIQESKILKTMDEYVPNEMSQMERTARDEIILEKK